MIVGAVIASLFFLMIGFFIFVEFEYPKPEGWSDNFSIKSNPVTQNLRVYDIESNTTIFWTPGNPVIFPVKVKKVAPNRWIAEFEEPIP